MINWNITPYIAHNNDGKFNFPENTGDTSIEYRISYTGDNGCTATTVYTIPKCTTSYEDITVIIGIRYVYDSQIDCNDWSFNIDIPYYDSKYGDLDYINYTLVFDGETLKAGDSNCNYTYNVGSNSYYIFTNKTVKCTFDEYTSLYNTMEEDCIDGRRYNGYIRISKDELNSGDLCNNSNLVNVRVTGEYFDNEITHNINGVTGYFLGLRVELEHGGAWSLTC